MRYITWSVKDWLFSIEDVPQKITAETIDIIQNVEVYFIIKKHILVTIFKGMGV